MSEPGLTLAVSRKVRGLEIDLTAARNPMITTLSKSLYTCGTLTCLKVKALVLDDIPEEYPICLASLRYLYLSVSSQVSAHMFIGKLTAGAPLLKNGIPSPLALTLVSLSIFVCAHVLPCGGIRLSHFFNILLNLQLTKSCNLRRCFLWAEPITTSLPKCLSSTLQTLEWRDYTDTQFDKDVISFLLKNVTCLTKVKVVPVFTTAGHIEKLRIRTYLSNLSRGSTACQLIFP
ncbi:hypothetical protein F2Q69_00004425 [Brassica cretica]|uniref:FBD domain-containing protein n=1 Tax=Brassica cretica TaxID=69181 RepID=A0A8S9NU45_BRACR|nr:hypothetical protein F2Q69_00004425 [Brassica cretica]